MLRFTQVYRAPSFASCIGNGYREEGKEPAQYYLLSNDIGIVGGLSLEAAVVGPEVD